jgi:hypothetical protein
MAHDPRYQPPNHRWDDEECQLGGYTFTIATLTLRRCRFAQMTGSMWMGQLIRITGVFLPKPH